MFPKLIFASQIVPGNLVEVKSLLVIYLTLIKLCLIVVHVCWVAFMAVVCVYQVVTLLESVRLRGLSNLVLLLRLLDRELVSCSWRGGDLGFNVPACVLWAFGRLLEIRIVRFRFQGDIPAMTVVVILLILDIVTILFVTMIQLSFLWTLPLRIIAQIQSTSFKSSFFVLDSLILLGGKVPPFLLVLMFLMLSHIKRLIILSGQLLLSP